MRCESKAMLTDRVVTIRQTQMFAPRALRHLVSSLRIAPATADFLEEAKRIIPICPAIQDGSSPRAPLLTMNGLDGDRVQL